MVAPRFNAKSQEKNDEEIIKPKKIINHFKVSKKSPKSNSNTPAKVKRTLNRFNGMTEAEVAQRGLPDYIKHGLDIVFIGINPGLYSAYVGHYYASTGNHFWKALYLSGFLPEPLSAQDDAKLLDLGIGFTDIVPRTTRGMSDLSKKEILEGKENLIKKLEEFKPKIAVFNSKGIYELYSGKKKFLFGRQPETMNDGKTWVWVMPSSSARVAQLPRAADKVPFFEALRKFRDYLNGKIDNIEECEVTFASVVLKNWPKANSIKVEKIEEEEECLDNIINGNTMCLESNIISEINTNI